MASLTHLIKKLGWLRWLPVLMVAIAIFYASSQPSSQLPNYGLIDKLVKKAGHITGYFLLALAMRFATKDERPIWATWLACLFYACTDEFHQSYVSGRTATMFDVLVYDQLGILLALVGKQAIALIRTLSRILHR